MLFLSKSFFFGLCVESYATTLPPNTITSCLCDTGNWFSPWMDVYALFFCRQCYLSVPIFSGESWNEWHIDNTNVVSAASLLQKKKKKLGAEPIWKIHFYFLHLHLRFHFFRTGHKNGYAHNCGIYGSYLIFQFICVCICAHSAEACKRLRYWISIQTLSSPQNCIHETLCLYRRCVFTKS